MKIGGRGVGEGGIRCTLGNAKVVKRKAAIKHCQSVANVVVIFIDSIDGKLSRDNPR